MPESNPSAPPRRWLRRLLLVAALSGVGYAGTQAYRAHADLMETLSVQDALIQRLGRDLRRVEAEAAATARTAQQGQSEVSALTDSVTGGHAQRLAAEHLLLAAAERAQLANDAAGTVRALELADARLATLRDPRLLPVRAAIAKERAAALALPTLDTEAVSLRLATLIEHAAEWPLATTPTEFAMPAAVAATAPGGEWPQRAWAAIRTALSAVFVLRRDDNGLRARVAPEQQALLRQLLDLKLETARAALLTAQGAAFRDSCRAALTLLAAHYNAGDPAVAAARTELERLVRLPLGGTVPVPSQSLLLLRALDPPR